MSQAQTETRTRAAGAAGAGCCCRCRAGSGALQGLAPDPKAVAARWREADEFMADAVTAVFDARAAFADLAAGGRLFDGVLEFSDGGTDAVTRLEMVLSLMRDVIRVSEARMLYADDPDERQAAEPGPGLHAAGDAAADREAASFARAFSKALVAAAAGTGLEVIFDGGDGEGPGDGLPWVQRSGGNGLDGYRVSGGLHTGPGAVRPSRLTVARIRDGRHIQTLLDVSVTGAGSCCTDVLADLAVAVVLRPEGVTAGLGPGRPLFLALPAAPIRDEENDAAQETRS